VRGGVVTTRASESGWPSPRPSPASGRGGKNPASGRGGSDPDQVPSPRGDQVPSPRGAGRGLGRGVRLIAAFISLSLSALIASACEEISHHDIGDEINILIRLDDQMVAPAIDRLARYRRRAIPQIETAMHTAAPKGRLHLIAALDKIGDSEAVPVLRHISVFDITTEVRDAAEGLLSRWAAGASSQKARAERARAALAEIARKRAAGIGPLKFGEAGMPGVPSTVGAPEPVGPDTKL